MRGVTAGQEGVAGPVMTGRVTKQQGEQSNQQNEYKDLSEVMTSPLIDSFNQ